MAFAIKGQAKATAANNGNFGVYGQILFKLCMQVAYWPQLMALLATVDSLIWPLQSKAIKATVAFKGTLVPLNSAFFLQQQNMHFWEGLH